MQASAIIDLEKYYDSLSVMRILQWLLRVGLSPALAGAAVRLQMFVKIMLKMGSVIECVGHRTRGCCTGSRVAVQLGRVPVSETITSVQPIVIKKGGGYKLDSGLTLGLVSWIDNIDWSSLSVIGHHDDGSL